MDFKFSTSDIALKGPNLPLFTINKKTFSDPNQKDGKQIKVFDMIYMSPCRTSPKTNIY